MTADDRTTMVKLLRTFFRIAAFVFLLVTFSFSVDETGATWIMWRDSTSLAVTLVALALLMAAGWVSLSIRLKRMQVREKEPAVRPPRDIPVRPYNIWGPMPPGTRAGLATAVFLIFGTIGPLNTLLTPPDQTLRPLEIVILTIATGGISASMIMFGHRKIILVLALALCLGILFSVDSIVDTLSPGRPPSLKRPDGSVTLTAAQVENFKDQRTVVAAGGIVLLSLGYVMFIVLLTNEGRQRARLQAEMSIARAIQLSLLPSSPITAGKTEAAGITAPASEVGGDYFDFMELPDGRLAVFAADVAGHGVGAGILGAMTKSAFRAHIVHDPSPAAMLTFLNTTLAGLVERKMFITAAYLLLDAPRLSARIATAGHPPAFRIDGRGAIEELRTPSMALGMDRHTAFTELEIRCSAGDVFLLYTDGVVESTSRSGEQFGPGRLKALLAGAGQRSPAELCDALAREAESFRGTEKAADDLTVVAVRV
ncbi:MAG TPA: PP2C family protein-serine/threonine phosphatase [Bacteroidota bacterium]|nr:PP2C family protein-serine/threonine phosphatase [Bacteroidota bacterium]